MFPPRSQERTLSVIGRSSFGHRRELSPTPRTAGGGLVTDDYDPLVWDSFFTEAEGIASHVPWMAALGNHEMEAWYSPNGFDGQATLTVRTLAETGAEVDRVTLVR